VNGLRNYSPEVLATLSNYDLAGQLLADVVAHQAELDGLPASAVTALYVLQVKHQLPRLSSFNSDYSAIQNVLHGISAHDMEGAGRLYRDWLARNMERQIRKNVSEDFEARIRSGASRGGKKGRETAVKKSKTKRILELKKQYEKSNPSEPRTHGGLIAMEVAVTKGYVLKVIRDKATKGG